ncbi:MarR family winged helix-turn-helix transcriptional regulator [Paractinoplanes brasiliensis]|uniref:DNA-binding MarR family transcriptional regulator n=1 Tax=Paractinoplanes brasiliensis TaxID=52695 RepID=A0A4R6JL61_9ACTN|nr:MarR family transcriptional regulator [Actinoplanes brasiliensis]TDO37073.1 DNA-binding MarR family transcriptional regulator [Actinoplanes brasiliensis]GID32233.1 MarR family transcriptional regulator [Actinoplanes brasiliensis]
MDSRWLNDDEQRTWRSFLMATRLLFDQLERDLKEESDLSFAYYEILTRLSEAPGRSMRMATLAAACVFDRSRLSHAVDRLVRAGWLRRVPVGQDGRGQLAELTDEGMTVVRRAAPHHVERVRALIFDRLTPDQQRVLAEISAVVATGIAPAAQLSRMGWPDAELSRPAAPERPVPGRTAR